MAHYTGASKDRGMDRARIYLKAWRLLRGLTQEQLAGRLDTTAATISRWENDKVAWDANDLFQMSYALQCDVPDLFRDPSVPEGRAWRIIRGMKPEAQERAAKVLEALASEDSTAA